VFLLLTGLSVTAFATTASARESGSVPRLVFPLVAKTVLWDNYGDPRPNGHHAWIDMEDPCPAFTAKANVTQAAIVRAPGELLLGRIAPSP